MSKKAGNNIKMKRLIVQYLYKSIQEKTKVIRFMIQYAITLNLVIVSLDHNLAEMSLGINFTG